jgi:hypothetical protein
MIDYEDLILARQERNEILEDNRYDFDDNEEVIEIYNPIILKMLKESKKGNENEIHSNI